MSLIGEGRAWLRAVFMRRRVEREMHDEMAAHIEMTAQRLISRGISERDARHAARREFGSVSLLQEQARDSRGGRWVTNFITDVRYAFRHYARTPFTSLTIVLTLVVGIGVNAAAYSFTTAALFLPPPGVPNNSRLVLIRGSAIIDGRVWNRPFSLAEFNEYSGIADFDAVAGWCTHEAELTTDTGESDDGYSQATYVTPNYFTTLGVRVIGPGLSQKHFDTHDEPELSTVVSDQFAKEHFGSSDSAIGKRIRVNGIVLTVVGVAPPYFIGAIITGLKNVVWIPLSALQVVESAHVHGVMSSDSAAFHAAALLKVGASPREASAIAKRVSAKYYGSVATSRVSLPRVTSISTDAARLRGEMDVNPQTASALVLKSLLSIVSVAIIMLVCGTTVASLLVGHGVARRHEIAVRLALGASHSRVVRQLLAETVILSLAGGAGGLLLFIWLCRQHAMNLSLIGVTPVWSTALFVAMFAIAVALVCGLSPALHGTRVATHDLLKDSVANNTSRSRLQRGLVVAQISCAQPLLVVLAMIVVVQMRTLIVTPETSLQDKLVVASFNITYHRNTVGNSGKVVEIAQRLRTLPGVVGVIPSRERGDTRTLQRLETHGTLDRSTGAARFRIRTMQVAPDYFSMLGIPVVAGRSFLKTDDTSAAVQPAIVRSDFASAVFRGANPIGQQLCSNPCDKSAMHIEIVGVIPADLNGPSDNGSALDIFVPLTDRTYSLLIRTNGPANKFLPSIRAVAKLEAPSLPMTTLRTVRDENVRSTYALMQLWEAVGGLGLLIVLLACIGLYAVVALSVGQRQREIGVRIALGAPPAQVVTMFFKNGVQLSVLGLAFGLPLSAASVRLIATQIGSPPTNTIAIALVIAAIVVTVSSFATWIPARRAAGVDPLVALRAQ